jgi:Fe-S-cluster containining protein
MTTSTITRLSRPERRALQREDAAFIAQPLVMTRDARATRSMDAHVRQVVALLRNANAPSPCSDAVAYVTDLYERTVPQSAHDKIVCRKGCAYCCTQLVTLTAPEAFFVARALRKRRDLKERIAAADKTTRGLSLEERLKAHTVCPLLDAGACSIYAARPLGCHAFVSVNLDACRATFEHDAPPQIPQPVEHSAVLYACRLMLNAALRLAGLKAESYELNGAVTRALDAPDTERRWLAGEDVLAGTEAGGGIPPDAAAVIDRIVANVAPTI